ncbi:hypothetical protein [Rhizobium tumorigenes]|uniref:hypothetical protein n=1 Tax=Rhizobium tumorigenes TaxID=2041385 RepID=UPI00241EBE9F|nr:hypothetical protein [Rhizobium tumorigenes]WFR99559.1 hypothetical protein PR016_10290 [Rhizobium tumorigenes]
MTAEQKRTLSNDDLEALRRHPAVLLAYCGLRSVIRAADSSGSMMSGLTIFIIPAGYRLDDYRLAAGFFFERDTVTEWANPERRKRVYQAPENANGIAKNASPVLSIFDLGQDTFLIARDPADIAEEIRLAADAMVHVPLPSTSQIQAARRLLGHPSLPKEVLKELASRSQQIMLAGILRRNLKSSDLPDLSVKNVGHLRGPSLQVVPSLGGDRPPR